MEARRVTAKNQIVRDITPGEVMVIASKGEWIRVIDQLISPVRPAGDGGAPENLIHWLINQGVYDQ